MKKAQVSQSIVKIFVVTIILFTIIIGGKVMISMFNQNNNVQHLDFKQTLDEYFSKASSTNLGSVSYYKMPGFKGLKYVCFIDRTIDPLKQPSSCYSKNINDNYLIDFINSDDESTLLITDDGHEPINFQNIKLESCNYLCIKPGVEFSLRSESSGIYIKSLE